MLDPAPERPPRSEIDDPRSKFSCYGLTGEMFSSSGMPEWGQMVWRAWYSDEAGVMVLFRVDRGTEIVASALTDASSETLFSEMRVKLFRFL